MKKAIISKKLYKLFGRTNANYGLIKEGDKILVGLSGGKDSLTMTHCIKKLSLEAPFKFEFVAATIGYGMGENFDYLKNHCKEYEIPYIAIDTKIFDIAQDKIRKNSSFCSFFSRMRRGILYTEAQNRGFNKVALAHHLDDAFESFFMNLFYNGALRSMPPIYKAKNGLLVIRPLIFARERQLEAFAKENKFTTIGDEACPAMRFDIKMPHAREKMKEFLKELEEKNSEIFVSFKSAMQNIHIDTFFDKQYLRSE